VKRFYSIGSWSEPSVDENREHLQEEVLRHHSIQDALTNFLLAAKKKKISVHGMNRYYSQPGIGDADSCDDSNRTPNCKQYAANCI
jgi:hypothetical protein